MWTEWANFYDQKHLLNNHQQLFFLSFFFCFACKEKEGWCSFFAPTSSTLICYNAELHSRLTIWSTGRIHSGPLACELVAQYQYRWSSSLNFLPLPISGKEKIEVKALQRFFFLDPFLLLLLLLFWWWLLFCFTESCPSQVEGHKIRPENSKNANVTTCFL